MADVKPTRSIVDTPIMEATVSAVLTFDICPFGPAGISYKPFPITGYPSELEELLEHIPRGQTSSDAHPLLRNHLKDSQWNSQHFAKKPNKIPKRVLKKLPDHVLERMGLERPKKRSGKKKEPQNNTAEKKESPKRSDEPKDKPKKKTQYCHTCKVSILARRYAKHLNMPGHIEKIRSSQGRTPDMSKAYAANFPYGTLEEDELDFPKFEPVYVAPPPMMPPLSYPLVPNPRLIQRHERTLPPMVSGHYAGGRKKNYPKKCSTK